MAEFGRLETESQVDKLKAVCAHCLIEIFAYLFRYLTYLILCMYVTQCILSYFMRVTCIVTATVD